MIVMAHFGFFIVYALRVNLSVVLVAMVNSTYVHSTQNSSIDAECKIGTNETVSDDVSWNFIFLCFV